MVFICFQNLFKFSIWDPIHFPNYCCWSCDNTQNYWHWDKTFISNRWPTESFPRSMWVKKFNLQITFMYIHFSHYANPPKMYCRYSWQTKSTWCFLYLFLQSMICQNQVEETLHPHLWVCEQFCCKILVQNCSYSLFQALTFESDPPDQNKHWRFVPDLHRKMRWKEFPLHIDQALIGGSKFGHVGVFVNYVSQHNI